MASTNGSGGHWVVDSAFPGHVSKAYDLAQYLESGIPHHPAHPPFARSLVKLHGDAMYRDSVTASSELITLGGHVGTHVDAIGHVARDGLIHGGRNVMENQSHTGGLGVGSVEEMPPLLGRGHLVDAAGVLGHVLEPDEPVDADFLADWFRGRDEPGPGDIVLVRTGWATYWPNAKAYLGGTDGCPGVDISGAKWLSDRGIVAGGSDTVAFEHLPATGEYPYPEVHVHFLVEHGIYIMEAMNLEPLAEDEVFSFTFVAAPLRIRGGTGSPIRPLALVA